MLRLVDSMSCITVAEVEKLLKATVGKAWVLLLTEPPRSVPKVKPGIQSLTYRVLDSLIADRGPLDESLKSFAKQRPRISYLRVAIDRNNTEVMTKLGVVWLPQVRVMKNGMSLFRSSVSIGDNGQFLAQDVGGKSFVRRTSSPTGLINLVDALSAELDR